MASQGASREARLGGRRCHGHNWTAVCAHRRCVSARESPGERFGPPDAGRGSVLIRRSSRRPNSAALKHCPFTSNPRDHQRCSHRVLRHPGSEVGQTQARSRPAHRPLVDHRTGCPGHRNRHAPVDERHPRLRGGSPRASTAVASPARPPSGASSSTPTVTGESPALPRSLPARSLRTCSAGPWPSSPASIPGRKSPSACSSSTQPPEPGQSLDPGLHGSRPVLGPSPHHRHRRTSVPTAQEPFRRRQPRQGHRLRPRR